MDKDIGREIIGSARQQVGTDRLEFLIDDKLEKLRDLLITTLETKNKGKARKPDCGVFGVPKFKHTCADGRKYIIVVSMYAMEDKDG